MLLGAQGPWDGGPGGTATPCPTCPPAQALPVKPHCILGQKRLFWRAPQHAGVHSPSLGPDSAVRNQHSASVPQWALFMLV